MFSSAETGAVSESEAASARSQRGRPPVKRRGPPELLAPGEGNGPPRLPEARKSSGSGCRSSRISGSITGAEGTGGLPRYLARDSPGRRIGSSDEPAGEAGEEERSKRGLSGRRFS